jgi:hypothetical protein
MRGFAQTFASEADSAPPVLRKNFQPANRDTTQSWIKTFICWATTGIDYAMTRIAALIAGLVLIGCPAVWLIGVTIPVPKYRKGGYADFLFLGQTLLAIYGSVLLGVAVHWVRAIRPPLPFEVFKAGMYGVLAACILFFGVGSLYSLAKYGSFDKAIGGTLWGMLVIFWGILGAFVSAGIALLFYAWRGPAGTAGAGPWSSPPRLPPHSN